MASLAVQPHNIQHVYISTPGRIKAVLVRPGQRVQQGDVLVRLANFRREDYLRQLRIAMAVQEVELSVHQALGDANQHALAVESMRAIREEAGEYEAQLAKLTVVAPCDGVVIAPQERHRHPSQRRDWEMLPTWSGSPLDLQNCDCFLDAGTHLLSVAPEDRHEAILRIDEPDRHDFTVGQDVRIEVDHLPGVAVRSRIERLAQYVRGESGPLLDAASPDTETPKRGGQAAKRVHEAVVLLPRDRPDLIPGARGRASILVTHRSAAGWLWRYVSATFKFLE
jgi:multidrug resistance efflux pump